MYGKYIKRILDFFLSLLALILLSPVLITVAVLVRIKLGSPVIFRQKRPGRNEEIFTLYKFRTMTGEKDENGSLLPDDRRLTRFGRLLRSTSLDELPELVNILKGDMSFVGPRPLLTEYLPHYSDEEHRRHAIRPGLTGWAQIHGRNAQSWEERFDHDLYYVDHYTLLMDIKIAVLTISKVIKRSDILVGKDIPAGRLDAARSKMKWGYKH